MKLRKSKSKLPTGRNRLRDQPPVKTTAFSYYNQRSDQVINTGRRAISRDSLQPVVERARSFWARRFGLAILLVVIAISAVSAVTLSTNPRIEPLTTNATPYLRPVSVYQQAASKLLRQSIWNRNKLTVNAAAISRQLTAEFPELSSVSVTLPLLSHRPIIYLQPLLPALILHASNGSFLLGSSGKALLAGSQFTGVDVPSVADQSGLTVKLNQQALTADNVTFIQTVVAELAAKKFMVSTMTLPAAASELDVQVSGQAYSIKFNLESNDARQQAGTYLALQARLASQNITPAKYVDVRVDGRAYYQ